MTLISRRAVSIGVGVLPLAIASAARTQAKRDFPERPIRIVVPVNAGGIADTITRVLQGKLGEELGQPIVVENKVGASGAIAGIAVAQSPPDGHTWLIDGPSNVILPLLNKSLSVDYERALMPVAQVMDLPYVFGVRKDFPADNLKELVSEAKRRPGEVTFGTTGAATTGYFMGELLQQHAGIKLSHIPFKGGSEVSRELLAGRIDIGVLSYNSLLPALQANGARIVALPGGRRLTNLPGVQTVAETYPGYAIGSWTGFFVPAGTPDSIQLRIVDALHAALKDPQVAARITETGCEAVISTRDEFRSLVGRERAVYEKLIREVGVRLE